MKKVEGKKQIFNSSKSKKYENHRNYFLCGDPPPPPPAAPSYSVQLYICTPQYDMQNTLFPLVFNFFILVFFVS